MLLASIFHLKIKVILASSSQGRPGELGSVEVSWEGSGPRCLTSVGRSQQPGVAEEAEAI